MKTKAKDYCKEFELKFEDIYEDMFIASRIVKTKAGNTKEGKHYTKWDTVKHRNADVFQILPDGDIVGIKNYLGGKYHRVSTRFIFTSLIINELKSSRV